MNVLPVLEKLMEEFSTNMVFLPDIAIFSKTMGNGYAITAVVGKRSVMEAAQKHSLAAHFGQKE